MTFLSYWFAAGAAGLALDVLFAILGFGYVHRSMQKVRVPDLPKKRVVLVFFIGIVIGSISSIVLGPARIMLALLMAKERK